MAAALMAQAEAYGSVQHFVYDLLTSYCMPAAYQQAFFALI